MGEVSRVFAVVVDEVDVADVKQRVEWVLAPVDF